jgi:hypothetical protein
LHYIRNIYPTTGVQPVFAANSVLTALSRKLLFPPAHRYRHRPSTPRQAATVLLTESLRLHAQLELTERQRLLQLESDLAHMNRPGIIGEQAASLSHESPNRLTVASFWVTTSLLWGPGIPLGLAVLAISQMGVHLVFFLHITTGPDNTSQKYLKFQHQPMCVN